MANTDLGFLRLRNLTAHQPNGSKVAPNQVLTTAENGASAFSSSPNLSTIQLSTLSVSRTADIGSDAIFRGQLSSLNKLTVVSGGADIGGLSVFQDKLSTLQKLTVVEGGADIGGLSVFRDNLSTMGALNAFGGVNVTGDAIFKNNLSTTGTLDVHDVTNLRNTLTVAGQTTLKNNLSTTGTLDVQDVTNLRSALTVAGLTTVNNNLSTSGNLTVGGNLSVMGLNSAYIHSGLSTLGTLDVQDVTNLRNRLTVTGVTGVNGTLTVSDKATLNKGIETRSNGNMGYICNGITPGNGFAINWNEVSAIPGNGDNGNLEIMAGKGEGEGSGGIKFYVSVPPTTATAISHLALTIGGDKNITAAGNVDAQDVTIRSDQRIKSNISTLADSLSTVKQLRGVSYNLTEGNAKKIGLIAQEVEQIIPEVVYTDNTPEQYKSVAYGNIVAVLIEAVKELSAKVENLEKQISA